MYGGLLGKSVVDEDAYTLALADPDLGAGHLPVVGPDLCLGMGLAHKRDLASSSAEAKLSNLWRE
jgi:hypothetical protein